MFDRFTDHARAAFVAAREAALEWRHPYIGTEHVLLGLLATHPSTATAVIEGLGLDPTAIRDATRGRLSVGDAVLAGQIPFTSSAKHALESALEQSTDLGTTRIGTEHLLLGLLDVTGIASEVLAAAGLDLARARTKVSESLAAGAARRPPAATRVARAARHDGANALLGLLRSGDEGVRASLRAAGADLAVLREELLRRVRENAPRTRGSGPS